MNRASNEMKDVVSDSGRGLFHRFPLFQLCETGEIALEMEEGRFASETSHAGIIRIGF
jgi:hypothetical protein